jgi:hypothetical protein
MKSVFTLTMGIWLVLFLVSCTAKTQENPAEMFNELYELSIYDIQVSELTVSFGYTIKNNNEIPVWFHESSGTSMFGQKDDTILIAPNYSYQSTEWEGTGFNPFFDIKTIQIDPMRELKGNYHKEQSGYLKLNLNEPWEHESELFFHDFLTADFIDVTLVLTPLDVINPYTDRQYKEFLEENAILINKVVEIPK